jgi:SAM-dependent methyltransferase
LPRCAVKQNADDGQTPHLEDFEQKIRGETALAKSTNTDDRQTRFVTQAKLATGRTFCHGPVTPYPGLQMNYDSLAKLYQRQYANYRDDIAFYARLAEREQAKDILELGAGAGRVSVALARRGLNVTGLELSREMLERGRRFAAQENVSVNFVLADMKDFKLEQKFPLIIAPFNALMHLYSLSDQDRALEMVCAHLEPNGVFAFDLYQPKFGLEGVLRHEGETFLEPDGSRLDVFVLQRIDRSAQMAFTTYFVDSISPEGKLTRELLELQQRYFTRFEVERWLRSHGFRSELHGDFDGARLTDLSPQIIVVARI